MGKRSRRRVAAGPKRDQEPPALSSIYNDPEAGELELRAALTPRTRMEYAKVLAGGVDREDAWQRAIEFLFERLTVSWTIAELRIDRQRELLGRYRMAGQGERRFVRESLRRHLTEHFPEMQAP